MSAKRISVYLHNHNFNLFYLKFPGKFYGKNISEYKAKPESHESFLLLSGFQKLAKGVIDSKQFFLSILSRLEIKNRGVVHEYGQFG
jgi:hypothetical protein